MKSHFKTLLAIATLVLTAAADACAVDIYVLSGNKVGATNVTTGFGKIDTETGVYTQISAAVSGTNVVQNLAWNPSTSAFYVTENVDKNTNLRTLSSKGTLSAEIGSAIGTTIYGMVYRSAENTLHAYDFNNDKSGKISPTEGGFSPLNNGPSIYATAPNGGRFVLLNDTIYVSENANGTGKFGTVGMKDSSTFTQIGANNAIFKNLVLATDGTTLFGVFGNATAGNQKLYSIDKATGALTLLKPITGTGLGNFIYGAGIIPAP